VAPGTAARPCVVFVVTCENNCLALSHYQTPVLEQAENFHKQSHTVYAMRAQLVGPGPSHQPDSMLGDRAAREDSTPFHTLRAAGDHGAKESSVPEAPDDQGPQEKTEEKITNKDAESAPYPELGIHNVVSVENICEEALVGTEKNARDLEAVVGNEVLDAQGEPKDADHDNDCNDETGIEYPSHFRLITLTLGLMACVLMVALDNYILGSSYRRSVRGIEGHHDIFLLT
jgi:hypothetical protein